MQHSRQSPEYLNTRALIQYKDHISRYGNSHYKDKMRPSYFIMGIPMLVRQHLYIESVLSSLYFKQSNDRIQMVFQRALLKVSQTRTVSYWIHLPNLNSYIMIFFLFKCLQLGGVFTEIHRILKWYSKTGRWTNGQDHLYVPIQLGRRRTMSQCVAHAPTVETLYSTIYYSKYFIELNLDKSTQYVALWTHKRHPIPRPFGRAMECLLWVFQQKLTVL